MPRDEGAEAGGGQLPDRNSEGCWQHQKTGHDLAGALTLAPVLLL